MPNTVQTNVRGATALVQAFLPTHKPGASLVAVSTLAMAFPIDLPLMARASAYVTSKLASAKVFEYLAKEVSVEDLQVVIIHPGVIQTAMADTAQVPEDVPFDDIKLASHFIIWAASREARFAHGKFLASNWDVEELKGLTGGERFQNPQFLTYSLVV
jgi:NAD(P)-dependent dehydrogenase (short-subunit alcohol dehydrogenase family)